TQSRQPLAPHAVHRAGLRPRLDLEQHGPPPVRRGDLHVAAQRRLTERDRQVENQVVAVALEPGILGDVEHRDEIARRPAATPAPPHAVQRSSVRTRTVFVVPAATSASVSLSVTFRSAPRCRSRARSPPPKIASNPPRLPKSRMKMLSASDRSKCVKPNPPSPPPPAPPAPAPAPRPRPASPYPSSTARLSG